MNERGEAVLAVLLVVALIAWWPVYVMGQDAGRVELAACLDTQAPSGWTPADRLLAEHRDAVDACTSLLAVKRRL